MNLSNVFYNNCRPSLPSPCSHSFEDRQILLNIQIYNFPFSVTMAAAFHLTKDATLVATTEKHALRKIKLKHPLTDMVRKFH